MKSGFRVLNVFAKAGVMEGLTFLTFSSLRDFGAQRNHLHESRAAAGTVPAGELIAESAALLLATRTCLLVSWHAFEGHQHMLAGLHESRHNEAGSRRPRHGGGGGEKCVIDQLHRQAVNFGLEIRNGVVKMAMGEECIRAEDPQHRCEESEAEIISNKALLQG